MDVILFILEFLCMLSIPCILIGLFVSYYAIDKNEKTFDFFIKMTVYSLLTCIITTVCIMIYYNV